VDLGLALKVSDFARSIFSATAALDIKRDKTEIRELTEKQSKITAPIKAAKKAEIEAKIKKLNDKIEILKKSLSYERDRQPFDMTFNSSVADTEKELADARKELKEAQSRLKKIK
jgi:predicted RNase H-like nuclease (RuvC/YqgF family)